MYDSEQPHRWQPTGLCRPWDSPGKNTGVGLAFLYTNNETAEREIKKTITFTITIKGIKYLGINLPKETKDLYIWKAIKH